MKFLRGFMLLCVFLDALTLGYNVWAASNGMAMWHSDVIFSATRPLAVLLLDVMSLVTSTLCYYIARWWSRLNA
jgi:hypothetical protein